MGVCVCVYLQNVSSVSWNHHIVFPLFSWYELHERFSNVKWTVHLEQSQLGCSYIARNSQYYWIWFPTSFLRIFTFISWVRLICQFSIFIPHKTSLREFILSSFSARLYAFKGVIFYHTYVANSSIKSFGSVVLWESYKLRIYIKGLFWFSSLSCASLVSCIFYELSSFKLKFSYLLTNILFIILNAFRDMLMPPFSPGTHQVGLFSVTCKGICQFTSLQNDLIFYFTSLMPALILIMPFSPLTLGLIYSFF